MRDERSTRAASATLAGLNVLGRNRRPGGAPCFPYVGAALVWITHRPATLHLADRVVVVQEGRVAERVS
ncbi:hypothetical protein [Pseudonocardia thermophila]|uniref:hypothetical protein n=1 Tax=Pseudonocardia thermophila TaxID=1848 RepID=UPI000936786B|nr:hypothetical protein [Pseudonocardia thermophila]